MRANEIVIQYDRNFPSIFSGVKKFKSRWKYYQYSCRHVLQYLRNFWKYFTFIRRLTEYLIGRLNCEVLNERNVHTQIHNLFAHRTLFRRLNYLSKHNTNEGNQNYGKRKHFNTNWFSHFHLCGFISSRFQVPWFDGSMFNISTSNFVRSISFFFLFLMK